MTDVDHAFQYSVEVKSRFSLFLDDNLNNEDPDLLISKIQQTKRSEKKKEKNVKVQLKEESQPPASEVDVKENISLPKDKPVRTQKSPKNPEVVASETPTDTAPIVNASSHPQNIRGRGGLRGVNRNFRGRVQGFRQFHDAPESAGDAPRDVNYVPRGRGRGRGRGGYGRGQAYTDYREHEGSKRNIPDEPVEMPTGEVVAQDVAADQPTVEDEQPNASEPAEEPKVLTLEEYKALRSSQRPAVALSSKNTRKPNDGKDVFANMVAHRKINEVSDEEVVEVEREPEGPQHNINWTYTDRQESRGRGYGDRGYARGRNPRGPMPRGRGARGEFRGRGGRGFERQAAPPVIYSDQDFPSLK